MALTCQSEPFEPIIAEIAPLGFANWRETAEYKNVRQYDPDWGIFLETERKGRLFCVTLRDTEAGNKLVGYVVGYYGTGTHCKGRWSAIADAYYIIPEYRARGALLMFRRAMKLVSQHPQHAAADLRIMTTPSNDAGSFFRAMGYSEIGTIWSWSSHA